ncbi:MULTISPECIES: GMC oxidoreductase [Chroococcidiopsis]|jgi:cholesterol oxidase|uniref:Cholesterol oxidase n=1 Tax=Chroococcidiopsis thermalis (strain PCC 7203) TaxID=251229 RepID=K9U1P4_CHRTP|nr:MULTISPECIES: GMC oxidoreductase [Chroococcidiopsis]AFY88750.1 Cholesterol oxidase [Chroococcidiopsis thermalis PCC 7203]PSB47436.1 GMC family oxidoreductase [Cyanosarcina cf. burmensis CCALA 770]PSM50320.1 GMC family oxidoreductase [Chroococcidiopsis sp. CCALA 051]URD48068.1 GMC oxidoreductase [Chroococcidiopsis sp. CCNUC1]
MVHKLHKNDESVEALVIGSGFGGAVAALRLGQAGINTVVLERGRRWQITPAQNTFATPHNPDGRAAWLSPATIFGQPIDVHTGVMETLVEDGIIVLNGAGVGGGSLVYNSIIYQPIPELFQKVFPGSISYDEMDTVYYPRVHSILQPSPIPPDILNTIYYDTTRLFIQHATQAGFRNHLLELAVDWNIVREEINGTKVQSTIVGDHWWGINSGAKKSLDRNYLSQAEKTGFVEILPLHVAVEIAETPEAGYRVSCHQINESGEVVEQKSFRCRYLFLAAGSMGTSKLLVKAKATGSLPRLNDYVGKFWSSNGDTIATRSNLPPVSGKGGPAGAVLENFDDLDRPIVLINLENWASPEGTQQCLGLGLPSQSGTFTYDASTDSVKLHYPRETQLMVDTEKTYKTLDSKNAISTKTPMTEMKFYTPTTTNRPAPETDVVITAHPLGGAVLGKACDDYGQVSGYRGLYVVDGALIPGSTGCTNPAYTIAALAERCMDRIIADIH